jgi:hypothetical protein
VPDAGQRGKARRGQDGLVDRRMRIFLEEAQQPAGRDPRVPARLVPGDQDP